MTNEKEQLDSWDGFISGNFLKAVDVDSQEDAYACVGVELVDRDGVGQVRLNLQRNEKDADFDLNKTNAKKLKELGIETPKNVIGKKIYFKKVLVRNPQTNAEVEGLRILKID